MRSLSLGLLAVVGLLTGISHDGSAEEQSASIWIQPRAVTVESTGAAFVDIFADIPAPGLAVWWLDVGYDPNVLFADYCEPPSIASTAGFCHSTDKRGTISASGEIEAGLVGRFRLARLPFTAIAPPGSHTDITVTSVRFVDAAGNPLTVGTTGGSVTVEGEGSNSLITGTVFNDANGNGTKDDGESGISRHIEAVSEQITFSGSSKSDGAYLISAFFFPGTYTAEAFLNELAEGSGFCGDGPGSFDPLWHVGCRPHVESEWEATTLQPVAFSIAPGEVAKIDFGGRRLDQQVVRGGALVGDNHAPDGTPIHAWVGGTLCGEAPAAVVGGAANFNFAIKVMGAGKRPGCASDGDTVSFTIGKAPATQTLTWDTESAYRELDLTAIPDHAWLWVEQPAPLEPSSLGITVEAIVNGQVCATTTIARTYQGFMPGPPPIGFTKLAVPSNALVPGCGTAGGVVSFRIGGETSAFATTWQPGLRRIDIPLPGMGKAGDDDCNGVVDAEDALGILRWVATQGYFGKDCRISVDVDCDGDWNTVDALHILRFVAGLPSRAPDGCPGVGG